MQNLNVRDLTFQYVSAAQRCVLWIHRKELTQLRLGPQSISHQLRTVVVSGLAFPLPFQALALEWEMEAITGLSVNDLPRRVRDKDISKAKGWRRYKIRWLSGYPAELDQQHQI